VESSSGSDLESEKDLKSSDDDSSDDDPASVLVKTERENALRKIKLERKTKRKAEQAESLRLAEKRKEVKLNSLQSISSGSTPKNQACHICGELGHFMANCSKRNNRRSDGGDHPRKPRKSN
jgi:biotin synthase-like enzyme